MTVVTTSPPTDGARTRPLRVMVVDDSIVIRGVISRWIGAESDMVVAAALRNGRDAVAQVAACDADVAVLDIEMPELDGISALPLLLAKKPNLVVLMASTLTRRNAEISLKALSLGAADYIPKPEGTHQAGAAEAFRAELIRKVRQFGARLLRPPVVAAPSLVPRLAPQTTSKIALRPLGLLMPKALVIGSSTGGPQALMTLMAQIGPVIDRVPVLITQHMPATFTTILGEHLARAAGKPAREAEDGEAVKAGQIYLAPGGRHMRVVRRGTQIVIALDDAPAINFCKPAVDPLFASAAAVWQGGTLGTILTGMGADGMRGGEAIVAAGGSVLAQDEATSVVWGMPGAAAQAGICAAILPLDQIGPKLVRLFSGARA